MDVLRTEASSHVLELALGVAFLFLQIVQHVITRRELDHTRRSVADAVNSLRPPPPAPAADNEVDPAPLCAVDACGHHRAVHARSYAGDGVYLRAQCQAQGCSCARYTEPDATPKARRRGQHA